MFTRLETYMVETIDKIGAKRHRLANGLLEIITRQELGDQVRDFGRKINQDYAQCKLTLIPVLHGGMFFLVDLTKQLDEQADIIERAIITQSYGHGQTPGTVKLFADWIGAEDINGRDCLIVDDILDSGATFLEVRAFLETFQPKSIKYCCLLRKNRLRGVAIQPDYCLFDIDNCWVVGYGLDGDHGKYRHLRYIAEALPKSNGELKK